MGRQFSTDVSGKLQVLLLSETALTCKGTGRAGAYGRAAFDSVGPGLLIGWAETGPGMLRFLYARPGNPAPALHGSEARPVLAVEELPAGSAPHLTSPASGTTSNGPDASQAGRAGHRAGAAGLDELLPEALRIDQAHRLKYHRPVSAETLRKQMRIGSMRARALVQRIRDSRAAVPDSEAHGYLQQQVLSGDLPVGYSDEVRNQAPDRARELAAAAAS